MDLDEKLIANSKACQRVCAAMTLMTARNEVAIQKGCVHFLSLSYPPLSRILSGDFLIGGLLCLYLVACCAGATAQSAAAPSATPVDVTTWRYDNAHYGSNLNETLLTPANVNSATFGKLFSYSVDGYVYAQPLYVHAVTMPDGLVHNVLFIATQHDSVYAFDADSNGGANAFPLWHQSMLSTTHGAAAGATTVPNTDIGSSDIVPEIGIASTPVIDRAANTIFVLAKTKENGQYIQRIHALNLLTGAEQSGSPSAPITASEPGNGTGSSAGVLNFSPEWQMNRVALTLFNGHLYIGFGSHGDNGPWHGWLLAYDEHTLVQTDSLCLSPNGFGNGVWGSGAAMPVDTVTPGGRLFLSAGNGSYSTYPPVNDAVDYSNALLRIDLSNGGVTPSDVFTPFNQATLTAQDTDVGSGGVLILPDQPGAHPHELVQVGKEGRINLLDRDNMGGYVPGTTYNTNIVQDISGQTGRLWSTPAYWNGHVFFWGSTNELKRFDLNNGLLSTTPASVASVLSHFPGASPVISSNGTANGIVWAIRNDAYNTNGSGILYAFDPMNLATILYESDSNSGRDDGGGATKFTLPVITNGKVYTGAAYQVNVYGLLNGAQQAAAPTISPNGGVFSGSQGVALSTSTPSSSIYYTTDGSLPTPASTLYSGQFTLLVSSTVRAIASAQGYLQSPVSTATFTFLTQTPAPIFSIATGSYTSAQSVTLMDSAQGAKIYYTTDGSTPTTSSALYSAPVTVGSTETIRAVAVAGTLSVSNVVSNTYVIQPGGSGINFGSGFAQVNGLTLNGTATNTNDSRLQLTNGGTNQAGSVFDNSPIDITSFVNDFAFQLSNAQADGFTFTIQNVSPTALGPSGGALGYGSAPTSTSGNINNSIAVKFDLFSNAGEGADSTGLYQNGASPQLPAIDLSSSGIDLHSGDSMSVHMVYDGTTLGMTITDPIVNKSFTQSFIINIPQVIGSRTAYVGFTGGTGGLSASQKLLSWTYASNVGAATQTPTFSPSGGIFSTSQSVTLNDGSANAVIYYTIDNTTPTISSPVYSAPIIIPSGTVTVKAFAVAPGNTPSPLNTATYTITPAVTATPTFTPGSGTYTSAQNVSISDGTAGAAIYYTTDGSTPTVNSTPYSGPINVPSTTTLNAIAISSGLAISSVATDQIVIGSSGATINYGSGFTNSTGLALNGSAKLNSAAQALELTDGNGYEAGSAWSTTPVNVSSFTSDFSYQMVNPKADGFTFTIQSGGTNAIGSSGSGLGYGSLATGGATIPKSVALKFDIFSNAGEGSDSIGVYTNGASPTLPATNITGSGILLNSGDVMRVHLSYNGSVLQVTITDTKTAVSFGASFPLDIAGTLGTTAGFAGFTGGTGGLTVTTNILTWTMTSSAQSATAEPTFSPAPGTYTSALSVSLNDLSTGSTIYYTVDGSQPSHNSSIYTAPIQVNGKGLTIKSFASSTGLADSPIVTGTYIIQSTAPAINFASGFANAQNLTLNGHASNPNDGTLRLTDGKAYEASSVFYNSRVDIQTFHTSFGFQLSNASADGFTFTLQSNAATALGLNGGALGYGPNTTGGSGGIPNSIAIKFDFFSNNGEGKNSTGLYINGASPTTPAVDMTSSGVLLASGDPMIATLSYDGTTLTMTVTDQRTNASFTHGFLINIPSTINSTSAYAGFTAGSGGLTATQAILNWVYTPGL